MKRHDYNLLFAMIERIEAFNGGGVHFEIGQRYAALKVTKMSPEDEPALHGDLFRTNTSLGNCTSRSEMMLAIICTFVSYFGNSRSGDIASAINTEVRDFSPRDAFKSTLGYKDTYAYELYQRGELEDYLLGKF